MSDYDDAMAASATAGLPLLIAITDLCDGKPHVHVLGCGVSLAVATAKTMHLTEAELIGMIRFVWHKGTDEQTGKSN